MFTEPGVMVVLCLNENGTEVQAGGDRPSAGNMKMAENDNPTPKVKPHWIMVDVLNSPAGTAKRRVDAILNFGSAPHGDS